MKQTHSNLLSDLSALSSDDRFESIRVLTDPSSIVPAYIKALSSCTLEVIKDYERISAQTLFSTLSGDALGITSLKLDLLFRHSQRLCLDINKKQSPSADQINLFGLTPYMNWGNHPLHGFLGNENVALASQFMKLARTHSMDVDLNGQDREGKTPFLMAIKLGDRVPLDLIGQLITADNYNLADKMGVTPAMMASAMRRVDVLKLIFIKYLEEKGCHVEPDCFDQLDYFDDIKHELAEFINGQKCPMTGKSLGHYATLRTGTKDDMDKQVVGYQLSDRDYLTVLNILKSVGIDGRRDKNALFNAAVNDTGGQVCFSDEEIVFYRAMEAQGAFKTINFASLGLDKDLAQCGMEFTDLSYRHLVKVESALLASRRNAFVLNSKTLVPVNHRYTQLKDQIKAFAGIDYSTTMVQRTGDALSFLIQCGLDLSLEQTNGNKTVEAYIDGLVRADGLGGLKPKASVVTQEDIEHIVIPVRLVLGNCQKRSVATPSFRQGSLKSVV